MIPDMAGLSIGVMPLLLRLIKGLGIRESGRFGKGCPVAWG